MKSPTREGLRAIVSCIAIVVVGIIMLANPEGLDGTTTGRYGLIRQALTWIWGVPGGIILVGIGGVIVYRVLTGKDMSEDE